MGERGEKIYNRPNIYLKKYLRILYKDGNVKIFLIFMQQKKVRDENTVAFNKSHRMLI